MDNSKNPVAQKRGVTKIRTKLKFIKSAQTGSYISFVSQNPINKRYCGVRQDSPYPKKVCVLSAGLSGEVLPNVLYDVVLVPMHEANGFVAIEVTPCEFDATVETSYIPGVTYKVEVKFGNKTILYDPYEGTRKSIRNIAECRQILERRVDIKNIMQVVDDFDNAASSILNKMYEDGISSKYKRKH